MWSSAVRKRGYEETAHVTTSMNRHLPVCRVLLSAVCQQKLAKRWVTNPYPFRPGYGLGSWIKPEIITGMKNEADARSKIMV
jgi:hypothetical protein